MSDLSVKFTVTRHSDTKEALDCFVVVKSGDSETALALAPLFSQLSAEDKAEIAKLLA
jgi:hypothetical protein